MLCPKINVGCGLRMKRIRSKGPHFSRVSWLGAAGFGNISFS